MFEIFAVLLSSSPKALYYIPDEYEMVFKINVSKLSAVEFKGVFWIIQGVPKLSTIDFGNVWK